MKNKITRGPWKWKEEPGYPEIYLYGPNPKDKYDCILSICESHGGGQVPTDADKALIEAAPDLLKVCIRLADLARIGVTPWSDDMQAARLAIAKATGVSP